MCDFSKQIDFAKEMVERLMSLDFVNNGVQWEEYKNWLENTSIQVEEHYGEDSPVNNSWKKLIADQDKKFEDYLKNNQKEGDDQHFYVRPYSNRIKALSSFLKTLPKKETRLIKEGDQPIVSPPKGEWGEWKTWMMRILAALLITFLLFLAKLVYSEITDNRNNLALLIGYDAAVALALDKSEESTSQIKARIDQNLSELGINDVKFPINAMGDMKDAKPAAEFSETVTGKLSVIDQEAEAAFILGWYGFITTNTPEIKPEFKIREYVILAGFKDNPQLTDKQLLEKLVKKSR